MSPNQLGMNVANSSPSQVEQMQMGFRSGVADAAGRYRNNSNPIIILNNPAMEQRLADDMMQGGVETLVTGAPVATAMRSNIGRGVGKWMRDARTLGVGRRATELADEIAPIALDPDPIASFARLRGISEKDAADLLIVENLVRNAERTCWDRGSGYSRRVRCRVS